MTVRLISFSDRGEALANRLAEGLGGENMRCGRPLSLDAWTAQSFGTAEGLIYVGAAGIAVRAIAPYVSSKTQDPAVVVVDETGAFAVSLLSGHLGGANDVTRQVARLCGAVPVITTATDCSGVFAVDSWARIQGCTVENPRRIKEISARLLSGETVQIASDWPIAGAVPDGVELTGMQDYDVHLTLTKTAESALRIIPKIAVLGVGCKLGTPQSAIEQAFSELCEQENLCPEAFGLVCSIDRKAEEPGLLAFCKAHGLPFVTFSACGVMTGMTREQVYAQLQMTPWCQVLVEHSSAKFDWHPLVFPDGSEEYRLSVDTRSASEGDIVFFDMSSHSGLSLKFENDVLTWMQYRETKLD